MPKGEDYTVLLAWSSVFITNIYSIDAAAHALYRESYKEDSRLCADYNNYYIIITTTKMNITLCWSKEHSAMKYWNPCQSGFSIQNIRNTWNRMIC